MAEIVIWFHVCTTIAVSFMLATFVVYSVVPELKNFQGFVCRQYLASYIGCMMSMQILLSGKSLDEKVTPDLRVYGLVGLIYFGTATILWLHVMSFDIWHKFRKMLPSRDVDVKKREKVKLIYYLIYAWGGSFLPFLVGTADYSAQDLSDETSFFGRIGATAQQVGFWLLLCVSICNACLYIWTALIIRKCKKETAFAATGANNRHKGDEQWFNLYVKLFVIMGAPLIYWAIVMFYGNYGVDWLARDILVKSAIALEALQGLLIFLIFVWKEDVKRSFREQFAGIMSKLGSCLRRDSTDAI